MNKKERTSGIVVEGNREEICDFAKQIEDVLDGSSEKKYKDWKPEENDDESDMRKKSAESASMNKGKLEEDFKGTSEEISEATKKIKKGKFSDVKENIKYLIGANTARSIRKIEERIYKNIMLVKNPHYFDSEDVSVNLEKTDDKYRLCVNILNEDLREKIKKFIQT